MSTTLFAQKKSEIKGVLFDLDGTLIDSAPGIIHTLSVICNKHHLNLLSAQRLRPHIGEGLAALLKISNPSLSNHKAHQYAREGFEHYRDHAAALTRLFNGVETTLHHLNQQHIPWGIVTNKLRALTEAVIEHLPPLANHSGLICKDDLNTCKPDPYPIIRCCQLLDLKPGDCLYLGDSKYDMLAASKAKLLPVLASYGYLPTHPDELSDWPYQAAVDQIEDILPWITT